MTCVIAGIGCRRGSTASAILSALDLACAQAGLRADALAAPAFKRNEAGLMDAARLRGVKLILVEPAPLASAQELCSTRSARAERATGFASICEASALAAAGAAGRLLLARVALGGVTCALAEEGRA